MKEICKLGHLLFVFRGEDLAILFDRIADDPDVFNRIPRGKDDQGYRVFGISKVGPARLGEGIAF
jgi:hypothetical protein